MKKLISLLTAVTLLASSVVSVSAGSHTTEAKEPVTETTATTDGWTAGGSSKIETVEDTVDGETKTVLKWHYGDGSDSAQSFQNNVSLNADIGTLQAGTYKISVTLKGGGNPGTKCFGITNDSNGGWPDNAKPTLHSDVIYYNISSDEYVTTEREVVVPESYAAISQKLSIWSDWGISWYMFVAEVKCQKKNDDGTYGANLVKNPNFVKETIVGTTDGWTAGGSSNIETVERTVNGVTKPAMRWHYGDGTDSQKGNSASTNLSYKLGKLEAGTYRITSTMLVPLNAGDNFYGITNDSNGGFPDNAKNVSDGRYGGSDKAFKTVTRDVTVVDSGIEQTLYFRSGYGATYFIDFFEVKFQKVNDDETLGDNLIKNSDFIKYKEPEPDPDRGTLEGWSTSGGGSTIEAIETETDGVTTYFMRWHYGNGKDDFEGSCPNTILSYELGALPAGTYRITSVMKAPNNPGEARYGITNDSNGGWPDNSSTVSYGANYSDYKTVTRDVTVTAEQSPVSQKLMFRAQYGASYYVDFAEVKFQKVNSDGTLGDNMIENSNFTLPEHTVTNAYFDILDSDGDSMTEDGGYAFIPDLSEADDTALYAITSVTNLTGKPYTVDFIVAVYQGKKLCRVDVVPVTANKGETVKGKWAVSVPSDAAYDGNVIAKAFVWDDVDGETVTPLTGVSSVTDKEI